MINKTILQGRLVRDPELKTTQTGLEVSSFTVAWSEKYGEKETQCFLNCTAWRQTGVFVSKYFGKGQEILVEGRLETRKYQDKEGNNRSVTELTVDKAHFCGSKRDNPENASAHQPSYTAPAQSFAEAMTEVLVDDGDLPF